MDRTEITIADIEKFTATHGQNGAKTLSLLGKNNSFYKAINSEIGQTLMTDLMVQMEYLLDRIINEKASPEERAEYRVSRKLLIKWADKIKTYQELKNKVKGRQ